MIATYLLLVEVAKRRFYAVQTHPRRPRPTRQQRHQRRIQRRAAHLIHHPTPQPRRARPVCVGKYRVAEYTALWFIANPNRVEKGGDHDGTVKRKGLLRQLQHLRRAVCHQDPACAGKQLKKGRTRSDCCGNYGQPGC